MAREHVAKNEPPPRHATSAWSDRWATAVYRIAAAAALGLLGMLAFFPVQSDDIFMYLAIGRRVMQEGGFPKTDPFLYSIPDYHWHILHEWAAHLIAYGLFQLGGWNALVIAKVVVLVAAGGLALAVAKRLGVRSPAVPLLLVLAGAAGYHRFIERSSLASDFFTAAVLGIVVLERTAPGRLRYLLPPIFLAWANLHPGFHVGLATCGLALLWDIRRWRDRDWRVLAALVLVSAAVCLVNPEGLAGVVYPLRPVFDRSWDIYRVYNYEWMPTLRAYGGTATANGFLAVVAVCGLLLVTALPRRPWFEATVFALLTWLGLSAVRFVPTAAFSLAVLGAALAAKSSLLQRTQEALVRHLALGVNGCLALLACGWVVKIAVSGYMSLAGPRHPGLGVDMQKHPERAAAFLDQIGLSTNLFNEHSFGSYLAWKWDGRRKLFYHGFVDDLRFYARNYLGVTQSHEEFARIVNEYRIGAFMLQRLNVSPVQGPLVYRILLTSPQWRLVYTDDVAMVFLRNSPENQAALERADRGAKLTIHK